MDIFGYIRGGNVPAPKNEGKLMDIKGNIHLFFEQSGVFKNEFKKMGFCAFDYDIQNNFGETDYIIDLFDEIERAYNGEGSIFDRFSNDDLIMAFFPCIYFSCISSVWFSLTQRDYKTWPVKKIIDNIIDRNKKRSKFFELINKLCAIALMKGFRLIIENPWSENHFFKFGFLKPPTFVDKNRTLRGDFFVKPTAYWFWNCKPTSGQSFQQPKIKKKIIYSLKAKENGMCSEERSMISPDYARNFICDFIIGKKQNIGQISLF